MKPTHYIIAAPFWSSVRDFVESGLVGGILKQDNTHVTLLLPKGEMASLEESERFRVLELPEVYSAGNTVRSRLETLAYKLCLIHFSKFNHTSHSKLFQHNAKALWKKYLTALPVWAAKWLYLLFRWLTYQAIPTAQLPEELKRKGMKNVVVVNFGFTTSARGKDRALVKYARREGLRSVLIANGWDNTSSKGPLICRPTEILTWNQTMIQELRDFHFYPPKQMAAVGGLGYDLFHELLQDPKCSKQAFYESLQQPEEVRIVTYACNGFGMLSEEKVLIKYLIQQLSVFFEDTPWLLLVRPHPVHDADYFQDMEAEASNLFVDYPGKATKMLGNKIERKDVLHYINTLKFSYLVINCYSTVNLDASSVGGRTINLGFSPAVGDNDRLKVIGNYIHNQNVVRSAHVVHCQDQVDFERIMNKGLSGLEKEAFKSDLSFLTGPVDGNTKIRILKHLNQAAQ